MRESVPILTVPEIRDYQRINAQLVALLEAGHRHIRLVGVEGQRLLVFGLKGSWSATIEVEGRAGPELAAELEAPSLVVVARGPAADGAGRHLRAGTLLILGDADAAVAYGQAGGLVVVIGSAGPRAGLELAGGTLVLAGAVGRLAGERQSGGQIFAFADRLGPHAGHGRRGGRLILLPPGQVGSRGITPEEAATLRSALAAVAPWLPPGAARTLVS
ncbi:MAG: glutamate synthase [Isosphaeraceae bacterium]|nr:glutamate synthase [Isosphaeraceae bacterium]